MTRWNLSIPDETDRLVRDFLARSGSKKGDLSAFVVGACRNEMLRRTVAEVHEQNSDLSAEEAMRLADDDAVNRRQAAQVLVGSHVRPVISRAPRENAK